LLENNIDHLRDDEYDEDNGDEDDEEDEEYTANNNAPQTLQVAPGMVITLPDR